jgi:hypothetical protein
MTVEPDNQTIARALVSYFHPDPTTSVKLAQIMGIDLNHAHCLLEQIEEEDEHVQPRLFVHEEVVLSTPA